MQMQIAITVEIPDEVALAEEDGFGQTARTVARLVMDDLRKMRRYVIVDEASKVDVTIPEIMSRGIHYGDS